MPAWLENGVYFNQSKAIMRKLAKKYGYESSDHIVNWRIDSVIDEAPDHFEKFYGVVSKRQFDDEALKKFLDVVKGFSGFVERIIDLFGSNTYIADKKISAADFAVAGLVFTYIFNDAFAGGSKWTSAAQEVVMASPQFCAWVNLMRTELGGYLKTRKPSPM